MKTKTSILSMAILLAVSQVFCHADIIVNSQGDARLVTEPNGNREDNNGGNTISGTLIGLNTGGIDNFIIHDFADLSSVAGQSVTGATVRVNVATGFMNGNHGTTADFINLHEIALGNIGWEQGTGSITGADTPATDGSVSYLHRSEFNDPSSVAWVDNNGNDVANVTGSFTLLQSLAGYNQGKAPETLIFNIDAATAQNWVDFGLGGLALSTTDDGDSRSRFNFSAVVGDNGATSIEFHTAAIPEPSAGLVAGIATLLAAARRRRKLA